MSSHGCVKSRPIAVAMFLVLATSISMAAEDLSISLKVDGYLDAHLDGLTLFATINGDVDIDGDVPCDEGIVRLSATGSIIGGGSYSILELMTKGWILMTASGNTADENATHVRSLLYASRHSFVPLKADDLFEGIHHTVIHIGESIHVYWGEFAGTLAGGLAAAETEGTIRLSGTGSFHLSGEWVSDASPTDYPETIPLDDPDLPEEFLRAIAEMFSRD